MPCSKNRTLDPKKNRINRRPGGMSIQSLFKQRSFFVVFGLVLAATFFFQNCQRNGAFVNDTGLETSLKIFSYDEGACQNPWDATKFLNPNEKLVAFKSAVVGPTEFCHAQYRTCSGGVLTGDFTSPTCFAFPDQASDCASPYSGGSVLRNGESVTTYYVAANGQCLSDLRTCNRGTLSPGQGHLVACPGDNKCKTTWGLQLGVGQFIRTLDTIGTPAPNGSCGRVVHTYTCSAAGTLLHSQSTPACAQRGCVAPWGSTVLNGGTVTAYRLGQRPHGQCLGANRQIRTCRNGVLSGSFTKGVCVDTENSCALPWGGTIAHGVSVPAFVTSNATGGTACLQEIRTCNNGTLTGSHRFRTCTTSQRACLLPWSTTEFVAHGTRVTAYQAASAVGGSSCLSAARTCLDGAWSGPNYRARSCGRGCLLTDQTQIPHGVTYNAYQFKSSRYPADCAKRGPRTCTNGSFSGAGIYQYGSCTVQQSSGTGSNGN